MLQGSQGALDVVGKTVPELLRAVPMAQMGGVIAEGVSVLGRGDAGSIEVRRRPGQAHASRAFAARQAGVVVYGNWRLWSGHGGR